MLPRYMMEQAVRGCQSVSARFARTVACAARATRQPAIVNPPLTDSVCPVMKPAGSDAKNTTAGAMSAGLSEPAHRNGAHHRVDHLLAGVVLCR